MSGKIFLNISGMHCTSCEKLLEDEVGSMPGVEKIKADRKKGTLEIFYNGQKPDVLEIEKTVEKFGYEIRRNNNARENGKKNNWLEWIKAILISAFLLVSFKQLEKIGIISSDIQNAHISYGVALIAGVVASFSSCLALVGAIVVAFGEKYASSSESNFGKVVKPNLLFHAGRLGAFFLLGGLLGFIGGEINISGRFVSVYTIVIAIVMGFLGLNILGLVPSFSEMGLALPKSLTRHTKKLKKSDSLWAPAALGGITFFLPCGFTQSMQILALASGSFWIGGTGMLFFALGTLPTLFFLGVTTTYTKTKGIAVFRKSAGILILVFAIYVFSSGLAIWSMKNNLFARSSTNDKNISNENNSVIINKESDTPSINDNVQIVEMHITSSGFEPGVFNLKKGVPVEWKIYGDNISGCTNKIIVPDLNITQNISSGVNIIKFTPAKIGTISFSCWMGMVRGKFIVE